MALIRQERPAAAPSPAPSSHVCPASRHDHQRCYRGEPICRFERDQYWRVRRHRHRHRYRRHRPSRLGVHGVDMCGRQGSAPPKRRAVRPRRLQRPRQVGESPRPIQRERVPLTTIKHPFHELKTVPGSMKTRDVAAQEAEKKQADLEAGDKRTSPLFPPRAATPMSFFSRSPKPKSSAQTAQGLKISKPLPVSSSVEPLWTGRISEDPFSSAPASASAVSLPQTWGAPYESPSPPSSPPRIPLPEVPTSPQSVDATRATVASSSQHSSPSSRRSSSTTIDNTVGRSQQVEAGDVEADTARYTVGGIVDSYNRESTATDMTRMAFGSPGEDNVPSLPDPAPASPQLTVTPSPKRRFFGFGAGKQGEPLQRSNTMSR